MRYLTKTDRFEDILGFKLKRLRGRKISRKNRRLIWGIVHWDEKGMKLSGDDLRISSASRLDGTVFQGDPVLIDLAGAKIYRVPENTRTFLTRKSNYHKMHLHLSEGSIFILKTNCTKTELSTFGNKVTKSNRATDRVITEIGMSADGCVSIKRSREYYLNPNRIFSTLDDAITEGISVSKIFTNSMQ